MKGLVEEAGDGESLYQWTWAALGMDRPGDSGVESYHRDNNWLMIVQPCEIMRGLNQKEKAQLSKYEKLSENGQITFVQIGRALSKIKEGKLYQGKYTRFEDYCQKVWHIQKGYAYQLIGASQVVDFLSKEANVSTLPLRESQVRPLLGLSPNQIREIWKRAVKEAKRKKITAKMVKEQANQYLSKDALIPNQKTVAVRKKDKLISNPDTEKLEKILDNLEESITNNQSACKSILKRIANVRELLRTQG